jgi:hypothetical protein
MQLVAHLGTARKDARRGEMDKRASIVYLDRVEFRRQIFSLSGKNEMSIAPELQLTQATRTLHVLMQFFRSVYHTRPNRHKIVNLFVFMY